MERRIIELDEGAIGFQTSNSSDCFDRVIGHIEDIVMEEEFQNLQRNFLENNWQKFEDSEENKLEYMDIFSEYTNTIENYIVNRLKLLMEDFDMDTFTIEFNKRKPQLDGEIFDLLMSFTDFTNFKEMILDYKADKEGKYKNINLGITVTKIPEEEFDDEE